MKHEFQVSIRELMVVVFVAALGLAGLSMGGWMAYLTVLLVIMVTTALSIVAFVGHGKLRSFAIGFLGPLFVYVGSHAYVGSTELHPYGTLPTTKLLRPVYELLVRREYINITTGKPVPIDDPLLQQGWGQGGFGSTITLNETPDPTTFMTLAHALCAAAFAYAGGKFAVWVSCQTPTSDACGEQLREPEPPTGSN